MSAEGRVAAERVCYFSCPLNGADLFANNYCGGSDISVWTIAERRQVNRIKTTLKGSAQFAIVTSKRPILVTANYERHGVSGYDVETGSLIWQRKDLKRGGVTLMNDDETVAIEFDDRPSTTISGITGETIARFRGIRRIIPSAYSAHALHIGWRSCMLRSFPTGMALWLRPLVEMQIHDGAIGPESILLFRSWQDDPLGSPWNFEDRHSEVRCISFDGTTRWTWTPAPYCHVREVAWSESSERWIGLEWSWRDGGPLRIIQLGGDGEFLGRSEPTCIFNGAFLGRGRFLISSEGAVLGLPDGAPVWRFCPSPPPPGFARSGRTTD